ATPARCSTARSTTSSRLASAGAGPSATDPPRLGACPEVSQRPLRRADGGVSAPESAVRLPTLDEAHRGSRSRRDRPRSCWSPPTDRHEGTEPALHVILLENVTKIYARGARPALSSISLEVERGEFVFLVGASGSGKSTFLRLVLREERPTSGTV